jgi:hypothetical protein
MNKTKFLYWIMLLLFGYQLAGCTYYMNKPAPADFSYQGNLIERDLGINQGAQ